MRKWLPRFLFLVAVAALVLVLRFTVFLPDPVTVAVVPAERGRVESTGTNSKAGTVKARQRASLSPETGGLVVEILRRKGEKVKAGEVLLRLNDAIQKARINHAQRALGASAGQVLGLFLVEAVIQAVLGGLGGLGLGLGLAADLRTLVPGLPVVTPVVYIPAALGVSMFTGLAAGVVPARRAAALDPIVVMDGGAVVGIITSLDLLENWPATG